MRRAASAGRDGGRYPAPVPQPSPTPVRAHRSTLLAALVAVAGLLFAVVAAAPAGGEPIRLPVAEDDAGATPGREPSPALDAAAVVPEVLALGGAADLGSMAGQGLGAPMVGIQTTPSGQGYWLVGSDGGVFAFGDATFQGSTGAMRLNQPIVGMASTPSGRGYWLVASDGGVFAFGDATFQGSTGAMRLNQPIVGMASTPSGRGYWLVASDGGVFAFGDAPFLGSAGSLPLVRPVAGMAATPAGTGYWLVGADGGVFAYGDARFLGRAESVADVVAVAARPGGGYATLAADGVVSTFGLANGTIAPPAETALAGPAVGLAMPSAGAAWVATGRVVDRVTFFQGRELTAQGLAAAQRNATASGAKLAVVHSGTVGMVGVVRGAEVVQQVTPGWRVPMSAEALPADVAAVLRGRDVGAVLARGELVMSKTSADLRGARAGDDIDILGWNGGQYRLRIGLVAPDAAAGSELLMSDALAGAIGFVRPTVAVIWGFPSRDVVDAVLPWNIPAGQRWRIRRSWDPRDPDSVLPQAQLKRLLGEFEIRGAGDPLQQQPSWRNANIISASIPLIGTIRCHKTVVPAIQGAMQQVIDSGLAGLIDVGDSRSIGGCYNAREIRSGYGSSGRTVSRHGWGAAIDINPSTNGFGATPRIDPRIVQIFRSWGFAWGGGFTIPDGMHFEYVGEPR
jgi:hypothetical protein